MNFPARDHIVWKLIAIVLLFTALALSKYLGYESWDSWKDIRASIVETLMVTLLFALKYLNPTKGGQ